MTERTLKPDTLKTTAEWSRARTVPGHVTAQQEVRDLSHPGEEERPRGSRRADGHHSVDSGPDFHPGADSVMV